MLTVYKDLVAHQYEAALCTLNACIDRCPAPAWDAPVASLAFCQVVFHALFFTDYYLGRDAESFRAQAFHREHEAFFRDYEELEPRMQVHRYDRPSIRTYMTHCRDKASVVIAGETAETLAGPSGFERRTCSRAELHVLNIRHVQHHAAALGLRLKLDLSVDLPWFGSGWSTAE